MVYHEVVLERKCDTFVESSIVHLLFVGQVGPGYEGKHPQLNSRRHSLPKSELENFSYPLYDPIHPNLALLLVKLDCSQSHMFPYGYDTWNTSG